MRKFYFFGALLFAAAFPALAEPPEAEKNIRKLHFIQDDAQDYMVSKLYHLQYAQSNDLLPFVQGMIMRYNTNSSANCITYGADNKQLLAVTCPVKMMPYVDDFIAKVDRNIPVSNREAGEIIKGTGITRAVYHPKFRSGDEIVQVLINSVIGLACAIFLSSLVI
jgi:hypothetical protein